MVKGKFCAIGDYWYCFHKDGVMVKGPVFTDERIYYFNEKGEMMKQDSFWYNGKTYLYFTDGAYLPEEYIYAIGQSTKPGSDIPRL